MQRGEAQRGVLCHARAGQRCAASKVCLQLPLLLLQVLLRQVASVGKGGGVGRGRWTTGARRKVEETVQAAAVV